MFSLQNIFPDDKSKWVCLPKYLFLIFRINLQKYFTKKSLLFMAFLARDTWAIFNKYLYLEKIQVWIMLQIIMIINICWFYSFSRHSNNYRYFLICPTIILSGKYYCYLSFTHESTETQRLSYCAQIPQLGGGASMIVT